jgi:hypothetical protein
VERWRVKVMSDPDAARVNLTATPATVADLVRLPAPPSLPDRARLAPTELTTYAVTVRLVAAALEEDSDIHLVVADPADPAGTMIVEFPHPDCALETAPALREQIRTARTAFVAAVGAPPEGQFTQLSGTAQIVGVGFFDRIHGQRGVAPNGIELHPVLGFALADPAGAPAAPPPPPAPAPPAPRSG